MPTTIKIKKSGATGNVPSANSLEFGELALNYADGVIYYKDSGGVVQAVSQQNTFETINANGTLIIADANTDILSLTPGDSIYITGDGLTDTITIGVKLDNTTSCTSSFIAATANAVKSAYDAAIAAYVAANNSSNTASVRVGSSVVNNAKLNFVNTASIAVTVEEYLGNANISLTSLSSTPLANDTFFAQGNTAAAATANVANALYALSTQIFDKSNNAYSQANNAYDAANTAGTNALNAYVQANNARDQANSAYGQANAAYSQANLAYTAANNSNLLLGGVITGTLNVSQDLIIGGNIYLEGNTTFINVATYSVQDPLIYLASNNNLTDTVDIGFMGGKNTSGTYSHTGLARDATDGKWKLFDGLPEEGHVGNIVDFANTSLATLVANVEANNITVLGNKVAVNTDVALAYNQANSAFTAANNRVLKSGDTMTGNLIFSGTGLRILGDMSNATVGNRLAFQTSVTDGSTTILVIPNGTGTNGQLLLRGGSEAANDSFGQIVLINGSEFRIASGNNGTGVYTPITFYSGGSERMRLDTSGNLGIGTASPGAKLEVYAASNPELRVNDGTVNFQIYAGTGTSSAVMGTIGSHALAFRTNSTERMRIDSSGNVGIGTTSPAGKLDIGSGNLTFSGTGQRITGDFSNATIANRLAFQTSTTNGNTRLMVIPNGTGTVSALNLTDSSDPANAAYANITVTNGVEMRLQATIAGTGTYLPMTFYTGGSERMRLDTSGRLGLGTAAPSYKLTIADTTNQLSLTTGTNELIARASSTEAALYTFQAIPLNFYTNNALRATIDSSGNVGIGTASPGAKLDILSPDNLTNVVRNGAYASNAISTIPVIETFGCRYDGNGTFGGRFGAAFRRADGTAIASTATLGYYAFGGQWGTDTTYQSAKLLYAASIVGVAEGSFTSATAMPTAIAFRTGSTGDALGSSNLLYGTERMRIAANGFIGVGTSTPNGVVHIVTTNNTAPILKIETTGNSINTAFWMEDQDGNVAGRAIATMDLSAGLGLFNLYGGAYTTSGGNFYGSTRGASRIGLHDNIINFYTANASSAGQTTGTAVTWYQTLQLSNTDFIVYTNNGTERLRVNSSGNAGIGTSSPQNRLHVSTGSSGATADTGAYTQLVVEDSSDAGIHIINPNASVGRVIFGTPSNQYGGLIRWDNTNNNLDFATDKSTGFIRFLTGLFQERMRIDSSGNVGIGGTANSFAKVEVAGNLPGTTGGIAHYVNVTAPSNLTSNFQGFRTAIGTAAASFTLSNGYHFYAAQGGFGAGSVVTNQYGFYADNTLTGATNNFGFYSNIASGTNRFNFYANGTADNYFAGNVGIGVTPTVNLEVGGSGNKTLRVGTTSNSYAYLNLNTWALDRVQLRAEAANPSAGSGTGAGKLTIWTANAGSLVERMAIDGDGNVGIGTTSPGTKLTVAASGEAGARFLGNGLSSAGLFVGYNSAAYVYNDSNTDMIFGTNAAERMRISASGNVGIGTASPTNKFQVSGDGARSVSQAATNTGSAEVEAQVYNYWGGTGGPTYTGTAIAQWGAGATGTSAGIARANLGELRFQNGSGGLIYTNGGTPLVFATTSTERMRIDSSGNVGIGTASPVAKLDIISGTARVYISNQSSTGFITAVNTTNTAYAPLAVNGSEMILKTGDAERMRIDSSGNVGIGGTAAAAIRLDSVGTMPAQTTAYNIAARGTISNSTTSSFSGAYVSPTTTAAAFTLTNLFYYNADASSFGAGSTVTNQYGFIAQSNLTGATNNFGFYGNIASGTNRWNFYAEGTANNYFAGNVGIGTTSPGQKLDVNGGIQVQSTNPIYFFNTNYFVRASTGLELQSGDLIRFSTNGANERMRIDSSGNVGIGTTSPSHRLHVVGTVFASTDVRAPIYYDSDDTNAYFEGSGALIMRGAAPTMYFRDTDHNSAMLHCNSNVLYVLRGGNDTTSWTQVNSQWPFLFDLSNNNATCGGQLAAVNSLSSPILYDYNNTGYYCDPNSESRLYRARIGPYAGSTTTGNQTGLEILNNNGTGDGDVAAISFHCSSYYGMHMHLRADGYFGIGGWSASSWRWYVNMANGDMTAAGNVTAYSDPRLKTNIRKIDSALDKVLSLNGVKFKWIESSVIGSSGQEDYGILSNEVAKIAPEIVTDSIHDSDDGDKYKTVAYSKLVPFLIEAIKELKAEIDILKQRG